MLGQPCNTNMTRLFRDSDQLPFLFFYMDTVPKRGVSRVLHLHFSS